MRDCPPDKIINPYTGRCVSRTGRVGRQLLRGEEPRQQPRSPTGNDCPRPCDPTKICNPQSRRCVSRTGTIGRRLLRFNSPRRQSPTIIRPAAQRSPPRPPRVGSPHCRPDLGHHDPRSSSECWPRWFASPRRPRSGPAACHRPTRRHRPTSQRSP